MNTNNQRIRRNAVWLPILALLLAPCDLAAQDRITIRDQRTGKITQFEAVVVAWDATRLVYAGNQRESSLPASRVVDVAYSRTETQSLADQQFESGQFLQAWQSYENAIAEGPRDWVKVELLARQLRCALALGRSNEALSSFFAIQRATPQSRFFHLIPLTWGQNRPGGSMIQLYTDWLSSADESQKLIAASWLLMIDEPSATKQLKDLSRSVDPRIAHLATAQLWRTESLSARVTDLNRWSSAIDRMPENLQAGARFQLALALKYMNRGDDKKLQDEAIVAMMQIPVLFPDQYQLAGDALLQANQMLVSNGRNSEASIVLTELKRNFAFSNAAVSLGARIENLDQ